MHVHVHVHVHICVPTSCFLLGTSRNRVMDIARDSKNPPIFILMLSADETVYNAGSLRKFCEEYRNSEGPMHEAYPVSGACVMVA